MSLVAHTGLCSELGRCTHEDSINVCCFMPGKTKTDDANSVVQICFRAGE